MEYNCIDILLIIMLVVCISISCSKLRKLEKLSVTGGKITDTVGPNEITQIMNDHSAIKNVAKLNYNFCDHHDDVMEITKSVISKK
jgi:hypothetical protein